MTVGPVLAVGEPGKCFFTRAKVKMSTISSIKKAAGKDGTQLMGSYTLYISQLITTLVTEQKRAEPNYVAIGCQIAVFMSILLARNYQNRRAETVERGSQSEPAEPARQDPLTPY